MKIIIGAAIVMVLPVVLASLFLCAPKWWSKHAPRRLLEAGERVGDRMDVWTCAAAALPVVRPFAVVGKIVASGILGLIVLPFALAILYVQACVAVIERACPYTHETEWRGFLANQWRFITEPFAPSTWDQ